MQSEEKQRGTLWPLLYGVLGAGNLIDFFYKSNYQLDDLLQGVGFLLVVPLAYLVPTTFALKAKKDKAPVNSFLRGLALFGLLLVIFGFIIQWGWV